MKFVSFSLASILASSVSATKLRGTASSASAVSLNDISADGRFVVNGLIKEVSAQDLDTISKSIVEAYNKVYAHTGMSLDKFHLQAAAMVEQRCTMCRRDDDLKDIQAGLSAMITATVGQRCTMCRRDDDSSNTALMSTQIVALHSTFEAAICDTLQASGSVNFANANGCSLSYLTMEDTTDEAQVVVEGTKHEMSESDMKVVKEALTAAYKEAFDITDNTHFTIEKAATTVSQRCTMCRRDDDLTLEAGVMAVARKVGQRCTMCRRDDDAAAIVSKVSSTTIHSAMEKAFCAKLANTGVENFANVHDCSIRFVAGETTENDVAQQ